MFAIARFLGDPQVQLAPTRSTAPSSSSDNITAISLVVKPKASGSKTGSEFWRIVPAAILNAFIKPG